jgi:translation initiation factor eIF-2B subunit alpha
MPVAAIEALILLLAHHPPSTTSETLSLLSTHTVILKRSVRNPIPLSAGTDLFQRYLISTLQSRPKSVGRGGPGERAPGGGAAADDFQAIRSHLMTNGWLFVQRAKEARGKIAEVARRFVRDGSTVLTSGSSRVVSAVLKAAMAERVRFRVVYVLSSEFESSRAPRPTESPPRQPPLVSELRAQGVPVAEIVEGAVAFAMGKVDMILSGAEGVVENGGIINKLGTYQLGILARSAGKPFYVVVESHKFVRLYPLGQHDLGIEQTVLDFRDREPASAGGATGANAAPGEEGVTERGHADEINDSPDTPPDKTQFQPKPAEIAGIPAPVDFTPPELITALITESGVHTPSAVSEELINIWY